MFETYEKRRTDQKVHENIPAPIRAALWASIQKTPEPKDRLQTFRLSRGRTCQVIHHTTGRPHFSETIRLWYKGVYCFMQFPADD